MVRRALSLPAALGPQQEYGRKGIMKVKTLRDSLSSSEGKVQHHSRRSNSVQFHDVSIREYNLVIGDNPSVSGGVPLSLDWTYGNPVNLNLEEFEECRGVRRGNAEMRMPAYVRQCLLVEEWNTPLSSIFQVTKEVDSIRESRLKTAHKAQQKLMREETLKAMASTLKKTFSVRTRNRDRKKDIYSVEHEEKVNPEDMSSISSNEEDEIFQICQNAS